MMTDETVWRRVLSQVHVPGMDLAVGLVYLLLSLSLVLYTENAVMRTIIGLPLVLFVPGFVLLLALYPHRFSLEADVDGWIQNDSIEGPLPAFIHRRERGVTFGERIALSFGLSIALMPPLAIALSLAGFGLTIRTVIGSLSVFIILLMFIGSQRRKALAPEQRFDIPVKQWFSELSVAVLDTESNIDLVLNVALICTVVVATTGFGYALFVPNYAEEYTEFSLVSQNEAGDFVFSGYPSEFQQGVPQELLLVVENQEGRLTTYNVVVELQRVETVDGTLTVVEREELNRYSATVQDKGTWLESHELTPTMTGENLRLSYMLYKGDVPADPTEENAYRHLYLWVTVSEAN
ncbi:DUF1616 domain-containing protein [Haladaptatus sp. DJG-WS-42]|uniref:DUF1616 domain-containing protein n=1 Tax=Haladaptatus sp. DJG-WS-42 TaxID=3120516 RepID=UPI0030D2BC68